MNNSEQVRDGIHLLPTEYFSPYNEQLKPIYMNERTHSIHHFAASWLPEYKRKYKKRQRTKRYLLWVNIVELADRAKSRIIQNLAKKNALLSVILEEKNIRRFVSYQLSRKYGGRIFVYKNTHVSISPTAIIDVRGMLKIGCCWDGLFPESTSLFVDDNARLCVIGNARVFCGGKISINKGASLILGDDILMNMRINIRCFKSIRIGDGSRISEECILTDSDNHNVVINETEKEMALPIEIKSHCLVGLRCVLLKGVTIGSGSVIAAGAVVTKDVPPNSLWGGIPARMISPNIKWK